MEYSFVEDVICLVLCVAALFATFVTLAVIV